MFTAVGGTDVYVHKVLRTQRILTGTATAGTEYDAVKETNIQDLVF